MSESEIFTLVYQTVWGGAIFGLSTGLILAFLSRRG